MASVPRKPRSTCFDSPSRGSRTASKRFRAVEERVVDSRSLDGHKGPLCVALESILKGHVGPMTYHEVYTAVKSTRQDKVTSEMVWHAFIVPAFITGRTSCSGTEAASTNTSLMSTSTLPFSTRLRNGLLRCCARDLSRSCRPRAVSGIQERMYRRRVDIRVCGSLLSEASRTSKAGF